MTRYPRSLNILTALLVCGVFGPSSVFRRGLEFCGAKCCGANSAGASLVGRGLLINHAADHLLLVLYHYTVTTSSTSSSFRASSMDSHQYYVHTYRGPALSISSSQDWGSRTSFEILYTYPLILT